MKIQKYDDLLGGVRNQIREYEETKKSTDRIEASEFNYLDFFGPGENKVSEMLAFLLNPFATHGQGDKFLKLFLKTMNLKDQGVLKEVRCEKKTSEDRRLDIFIEFDRYVVAIENKIWACDQNDQLRDYARYLSKISNDRFLLLYLNPYGLDPAENSIASSDLELLKEQGKLRVLSYKKDLFGLLDTWKSCCEAEKVTHFIEQFKDYLKTKITGKNSAMTKEIRNIIYQNPVEAGVLVSTYNNLKSSAIQKINEIAEIIRTEGFSGTRDTVMEGPFNYDKFRVFKAALVYQGSKLWIQLLQDEIQVKTNYYAEDDFDQTLLEYLKYNKLDEVKEEFDPELSKLVVADEFRKKVRLVRKLMEDYNLQREVPSAKADLMNK